MVDYTKKTNKSFASIRKDEFSCMQIQQKYWQHSVSDKSYIF